MVWVCLKTLPRSNALDHHVPISGLKITAHPKLGRPKRQNQMMPGYFNMVTGERLPFPHAAKNTAIFPSYPSPASSEQRALELVKPSLFVVLTTIFGGFNLQILLLQSISCC